jgi:glutaredoxin-related protein
MKKIAILQSNYIPWKGYFDMIAAVDEFILYDDMQFTKNDWRNRNLIKTPQGVQWLTVPVGNDIRRRIRDVLIPQNNWQYKHWKTLESNYSRAPHFEEIASLLNPLYLRKYTNLSELNRVFIQAVCDYLNITTKISYSWDYQLSNGKSSRLVDLCEQAGATEYITGPAAKDYIEVNLFAERKIKLGWFDYAGYNEYPQLWGSFVHGVTILDLLFNCGVESPKFMRYIRREKSL